MILIAEDGGRSRRRSVSVCCDEHGQISTQTSVDYGLERAYLHDDETGCGSTPIVTLTRAVGTTWEVWCDGCDWHVTRSSRALGMAAARRHAEGQ